VLIALEQRLAWSRLLQWPLGLMPMTPDSAGSHEAQVICAFCGEPGPQDQAVMLVVYPSWSDPSTQTIYSHKLCLRERLHSSVPKHPALWDGER